MSFTPGKHRKIPTVVDLLQVTAAGNYGVLGNLLTTDVIGQGYGGALFTITQANVAAWFTKVDDSLSLTGSDFD